LTKARARLGRREGVAFMGALFCGEHTRWHVELGHAIFIFLIILN
jgi:hypothetical protein